MKRDESSTLFILMSSEKKTSAAPATFTLHGLMGQDKKGVNLVRENSTATPWPRLMRWTLKPDVQIFDGVVEFFTIRSSSKLEINIPNVYYAEANPNCKDCNGNQNGWKRFIAEDGQHVKLISFDGVVELEFLSVTDTERPSGVRTSLIGIAIGNYL